METNLAVKDNDFEKVIKEIAKKQERIAQENEKSELNLRRKRQLALAIASVYYFLRVHLNVLDKFDLTLENFEVVEIELKRKAEKEEQKILRKIRKFIGLRSAWGYYLEFGHFSIRRAPVRGKQSWFATNPWDHMNFNPNDKYDNSYAIPPNYSQLLQRLFEKRYPQAEK